ncbi:integrase [Qipengyuania flava]|uniref:site-specific integrase n=1 Tax=Qipengyuania flava TaxID=192812 RepID=UPI000B8C4D0F|nr:site-specific integrase [Qipengyuania flava]ASP30495.1 integrase [Qipengyuania flava]
MCGIQNVTRKQGTYYYRKLIRLGADKPFRLRLSLKTTSRRRAALLAPALTLICERVTMNMMSKMARDGLTGAERAEIYRRQILVERDRLEAMHASLHILPPDDHEDIGKALTLRLGASEMAAQDGAMQGKVEDFLVARVNPDNDDEPIVIVAWSDLADSIEHEGAEDAAVARLAELGVEQSALREAMARKVVNEARIVAIREFREVLANPGAAYAPVPITEYEPAPQYPAVPVKPAAPVPPQPAVAGPWASMTPTEAVEKFFAHNPRTGGADGTASKSGMKPWTSKTREQFRLPAQFLEEVMEGRSLAQVTHDDLVTLNHCFQNLHGATFRKSKRQREMTILEIVAEYAAKVAEDKKAAEREAKRNSDGTDVAEAKHYLTEDDLGLNPITTNRHWGFLRQLTDWFSRHQPLAELDYGAFFVKDGRNQRTLRQVYTKEQGKELFSLPPWTGSKSYLKRVKPGDLLVHDAWYWVPLIAWYSGMRRDEICGMEVGDVVEEDGVWLFHIRDNETRRIKTISSERKLPVADELCRLGLPDYVAALRGAGEILLFPELASESGIGTMGDAYYKRIWGKIAKALPFVSGGQGIHAFRHTAINSLKGAKISEAVAADFAGHSVGGETGGRYSKDHIPLLKEAVDAIPVVTSHLQRFETTILPDHQRQPRKARPAGRAA